MDPLVLLVLALIVAVIIFSIPHVQRIITGKTPQPHEDGPAIEPDGTGPDPVLVGGGRRGRGRRNARRHTEDEEDDNEEQLPTGKVGTKKLRKLQAKAEKKAMREQEEALREDEKRRRELREKERKEKEEEEEKRRKMEKEQELKLIAEKERKEQEEYLKFKESFTIEEEGLNQDGSDEGKTLKEFIQYIKERKVVFLEDLAAEFSMRTQDVIDRINNLQGSGQLTGVVDDRGKFIYISIKELQAVAKFIKQRGRVSIAELAQSSNSLIALQ